MRVNGNLTDVPARDLRPGDVVLLPSAKGLAARYIVGEIKTSRGYFVIEVAKERAGLPVGHWQIKADALHVNVIR